MRETDGRMTELMRDHTVHRPAEGSQEEGRGHGSDTGEAEHGIASAVRRLEVENWVREQRAWQPYARRPVSHDK